MSLSELRICVEKPLPSEEHAIKMMDNKSHSPIHFRRLQAAFQTSKLWPKNVKEIKIQFVDPARYSVAGQFYSNAAKPRWTPRQLLEGATDAEGKPLPVDPLESKLFGSTDYEYVVKAVYMQRIQPLIPFKLNFVESGGDVRITFVDGAGSWSLVGTDCLRAPANTATLNYGWLDVPTIIHEFCHVLGMIHEHENPRGNTIEWNEPKVYEWAAQTQGWDKQTTYNNIIMRYDKNQVNGSEYDPESVMLYFFPAIITENDKGTQQNLRFSPTDVIWISKQYPGGALSPDEFYQKAYGESIGEVQPKTKTEFRTAVINKGRFPFIKILIIIIIIILIIFLIWFFLLRKRKNRRR